MTEDGQDIVRREERIKMDEKEVMPALKIVSNLLKTTSPSVEILGFFLIGGKDIENGYSLAVFTNKLNFDKIFDKINAMNQGKVPDILSPYSVNMTDEGHDKNVSSRTFHRYLSMTRSTKKIEGTNKANINLKVYDIGDLVEILQESPGPVGEFGVLSYLEDVIKRGKRISPIIEPDEEKDREEILKKLRVSLATDKRYSGKANVKEALKARLTLTLLSIPTTTFACGF